MITIIHGDDIVASRKFLIDLKEKSPDFFSFEGESVSIPKLVQIVEGGSLFAETKTVFIENLLSIKKPAAEQQEALEYIKKHSEDAQFVVWENKELTPKSVSLFPKAIQKLYKLPQKLFAFLDEIKPKNGKRLMVLFHELLQVSEAEFVFFMIVRQIRILLALSEKGEQIDEIKRMSPWQKTKLEKQSISFSKEALQKIYQKLYTLDFGQKTGASNLPLSASIDFLLSDL